MNFEGNRWIKWLAAMAVEPRWEKWKSIPIKKCGSRWGRMVAQCIKLSSWHPDSSILRQIIFYSALRALTTLLNNTYHWKSASSLLITSYSFSQCAWEEPSLWAVSWTGFCHSQFSPRVKCVHRLNAQGRRSAIICIGFCHEQENITYEHTTHRRSTYTRPMP